MPMLYYKPVPANKTQFVEFWSGRYSLSKNEHLYDENIGQPLNRERILKLYRWKNDRALAKHKEESVLRNFVDRLKELNQLQPDTDVNDLLAHFAKGGPIWRIFWLHCWQPNRFPIYDQHVHRAMVFIKNDERNEIPKRHPELINSYIQAYLPFHETFRQFDQRSVDKALWTFGKFLKEANFPTVFLNGD